MQSKSNDELIAENERLRAALAMSDLRAIRIQGHMRKLMSVILDMTRAIIPAISNMRAGRLDDGLLSMIDQIDIVNRAVSEIGLDLQDMMLDMTSEQELHT
jgi:hypothetical protein